MMIFKRLLKEPDSSLKIEFKINNTENKAKNS